MHILPIFIFCYSFSLHLQNTVRQYNFGQVRLKAKKHIFKFFFSLHVDKAIATGSVCIRVS